MAYQGVVILKDKLNGLPFNNTEEEAFRVFATFCGLGVQNVINYENIFKANAKQSVALEVRLMHINTLYTSEDTVRIVLNTFQVLSYHATASEEDAVRLMVSRAQHCYVLFYSV